MEDFKAITGQGDANAKKFMGAANNNLEQALSNYFDAVAQGTVNEEKADLIERKPEEIIVVDDMVLLLLLFYFICFYLFFFL